MLNENLMYNFIAVGSFCAFNFCFFGDPRTFFDSELLTIYRDKPTFQSIDCTILNGCFNATKVIVMLMYYYNCQCF